MPRKRTGTVQRFTEKDGATVWRARLRLADGSRPWFRVPDTHAYSEERAREWAAAMQEREDSHGQLAAAKTAARVVPALEESVAAYSKRWLAERKARGLASFDDDGGRLAKHILPILGELAITRVTRADIERVVEHLDSRSLQRATSEAERAAVPEGGELPPLRGMSWKTASHTWGLVTKMFSDACASKRRDLRIRDDNPVSGVRGPDRGSHKAKAYLYPSEFLTLVSSEGVPVEWRHTFIVTTYLYARAGEVNALDWKDVDLEHGVIHIHQAVNRRTGATTSTKSGEARRLPIEAELLPLLQAMHKASGGVGRVLATDDTDRKLSRQLQRCLKLAGVKRAELFDGGPHRKPLTFHDLRATGITWCAVRGDDPLRIMQRAGHATFSTTQIYIRTAENLRTGFGHVFPRLPASLVGGETRSNEQSTEPASADLPPPASPSSNATPIANHRETREYRAERPPSIPGASTVFSMFLGYFPTDIPISNRYL